MGYEAPVMRRIFLDTDSVRAAIAKALGHGIRAEDVVFHVCRRGDEGTENSDIDGLSVRATVGVRFAAEKAKEQGDG